MLLDLVVLSSYGVCMGVSKGQSDSLCHSGGFMMPGECVYYLTTSALPPMGQFILFQGPVLICVVSFTSSFCLSFSIPLLGPCQINHVTCLRGRH